MNDAYRVIVSLRPDASTERTDFALSVGSRQSLGSVQGTIAILDVVRNVGEESDGRPVELIPRDVLDTQLPGWRSETGTVNIGHWVFDVRSPVEFEVYPPAADGAAVEVLRSVMPVQHELSSQQLAGTAAITEAISLDDAYVPAIVSWMLHRSYSKDDETGEAGKANQHLAEFKDFMGVKTTTDLSMLKLPNGGAT
jgi:hypothetical protein